MDRVVVADDDHIVVRKAIREGAQVTSDRNHGRHELCEESSPGLAIRVCTVHSHQHA